MNEMLLTNRSELIVRRIETICKTLSASTILIFYTLYCTYISFSYTHTHTRVYVCTCIRKKYTSRRASSNAPAYRGRNKLGRRRRDCFRINTMRVLSKNEFVKDMSKLKLELCDDTEAAELDENKYDFDPICPKMINLHDKARERLAMSDLVRNHQFIFLVNIILTY